MNEEVMEAIASRVGEMLAQPFFSTEEQWEFWSEMKPIAPLTELYDFVISKVDKDELQGLINQSINASGVEVVMNIGDDELAQKYWQLHRQAVISAIGFYALAKCGSDELLEWVMKVEACPEWNIEEE